MFERFSRSYYLGRLYVAPTRGEHAIMEQTQHERINEAVYATGDGIERLDNPLVMKLESGHFPVHGDASIPTNTLAVPESMLEATQIRNPPTLREVWLANGDRAEQLLNFGAGHLVSGSSPLDDDDAEPAGRTDTGDDTDSDSGTGT